MRATGDIGPSGSLGLQVISGGGEILPAFDAEAERIAQARSLSQVPAKELTFAEILRFGTPQQGLDEDVNRWRRSNIRNLWRGARRVLAARAAGKLAGGLSVATGALSIVVIRANGEVLDLGLASLRVVTDAGVQFLVDCLQNLQEPETLKYHGLGTGTTAEAAGDTALVTELTTEYNPNSTRATGSLTEGASANVFRTVGTNTVDASAAVTEHGIFSQAAAGGGTLLDRSKFAVVNLSSGDSLQTTYDFTITSGG